MGCVSCVFSCLIVCFICLWKNYCMDGNKKWDVKVIIVNSKIRIKSYSGSEIVCVILCKLIGLVV